MWTYYVHKMPSFCLLSMLSMQIIICILNLFHFCPNLHVYNLFPPNENRCVASHFWLWTSPGSRGKHCCKMNKHELMEVHTSPSLYRHLKQNTSQTTHIIQVFFLFSLHSSEGYHSPPKAESYTSNNKSCFISHIT